MVYGIWVYGVSHGESGHAIGTPWESQFTLSQHTMKRGRDAERKTSIKADSVHNLKRGSSSEEMPCCCCYVVVAVWVVCFGKVDDADAKMNWMAWLGTRKRTSGEHSA